MRALAGDGPSADAPGKVIVVRNADREVVRSVVVDVLPRTATANPWSWSGLASGLFAW